MLCCISSWALRSIRFLTSLGVRSLVKEPCSGYHTLWVHIQATLEEIHSVISLSPHLASGTQSFRGQFVAPLVYAFILHEGQRLFSLLCIDFFHVSWVHKVWIGRYHWPRELRVTFEFVILRSVVSFVWFFVLVCILGYLTGNLNMLYKTDYQSDHKSNKNEWKGKGNRRIIWLTFFAMSYLSANPMCPVLFGIKCGGHFPLRPHSICLPDSSM